MDNIGRLHDVKLAFNSDPKSCPEMAECLAKRNLDDFEVHINGLVSVCQVSGDRCAYNNSHIYVPVYGLSVVYIIADF